MPGITHTFVSGKPDSTDATLVNPSNWNENHSIDCFDDNEAPTVSNATTLILAAAPSPAASLRLFKNGILLTYGVDYTLASATITLNAGYENVSGDVWRAYYRRES